MPRQTGGHDPAADGAVLVVGPSWVGDMVMAQSLFKVLHANAPERPLDVLAPDWSLPLLARMPEVREGLEMPLGHGKLGKHCELYHPAEVRELYEPFFDDPRQLFAPYFPFGCNNLDQDLWVIDASLERAATIWHETVPDDWPDEDWLEYDRWVSAYLDRETGAIEP